MTNEYDDAYPLWDGTDYTNSISERNTMKYHMPKPSRRGQGAEPYFSEYQMQSAFDAGRMTGIEEAALFCDDYAENKWALYKGRAPYDGSEDGRASPDTQGQSDGASECADAIRNLKETPCV